jgi:hypothetical protein
MIFLSMFSPRGNDWKFHDLIPDHRFRQGKSAFFLAGLAAFAQASAAE